jgi:hypothetical protein
MKQLIIFLLTYNFMWAQSDVPLTLRAQFNGQYGYTIIGNTHNEFDNWQNPAPSCQMLTQSNATLNLLPSQNIVAAYLYWGGIGDGTFNPTVQLNGLNYSAQQTFVSDPFGVAENSYFNSFCDVTSQVVNSGNTTYNFSNFNLNPIISNYCSNAIYNAGWNIIVVYNQVGLPNIQLNIYDGNNGVSDFFNNGVTQIYINNLNVIDTQNSKISYVALNGSPNLFFNESITFNGNTLSNTLNPPNNPFNGTNSFNGSTTNWNQDIDTFDISSFLNIGDTQATITMNSIFIRFIQTIVTSIRSELPDATATINNVTGQEVCGNRDVTINYTISNTNSNAVLPIVPVSFYADGILLQTVNTSSSIAIGDNLNVQTVVSIPTTIPDTFTLTVNVDNSAANTSTVPESNENNNIATQIISLTPNNIVPNFSIATTYCENATVPILENTSLNNISGSWFPATIDNQNSGSYVFTPNSGQCATSFTLNVTINPRPTVSVSGNGTICANQTALFEFTGSPNTIVSYTLNNGTTQVIPLNSFGLATVTVTNVLAALSLHVVNVFDSITGCSMN